MICVGIGRKDLDGHGLSTFSFDGQCFESLVTIVSLRDGVARVFSLTFELELGPSWRTLFLRREDSVRKTQVNTFVYPIVDAR